jgi:hypothetical protein
MKTESMEQSGFGGHRSDTLVTAERGRRPGAMLASERADAMSDRLPWCRPDAVTGRAELDWSTSPSRAVVSGIIGSGPAVGSGAASGHGFPEPNQSLEATATRSSVRCIVKGGILAASGVCASALR